MPAYIIAEQKITDPTKFEEYRIKVAPTIARYGGRQITRSGSHKVLEKGYWQPERVIIVEFPDMATLNAWYNSAEYEPLIKLRQEATTDMLIAIDGA